MDKVTGSITLTREEWAVLHRLMADHGDRNASQAVARLLAEGGVANGE